MKTAVASCLDVNDIKGSSGAVAANQLGQVRLPTVLSRSGDVMQDDLRPRRGPATGLPPVHKLDEIKRLLVGQAVHRLGLLEKVMTVKKVIRIGTLCSGTESPVLGIDYVSDVLGKEYGLELRFDHVMSAEIDPTKQAFITRNFQPAVLFRDITEFSGSTTATTAYGQVAEIPGDIDILVAGFSCVDFSRLNARTQRLKDSGESGDTFRAIVAYAIQMRPKIIILENVLGAPWELIRAIWRNDKDFLKKHQDHGDWSSYWPEEHVSYACEYVLIDTKDYFLPQTRQRGYMVCFDRKLFANTDALARRWMKLVLRMKRPATGNTEDFLLEEEDSRLERINNDLAKAASGKPAAHRETAWVLSAGRYDDYRHTQMLGDQRPFTQWVSGGLSKAPDHWRAEQMSQMGERIQETLEISMLRSILRGVDPSYKTRVWELSQNVDRAGDGAPPGMLGCLTPNGIPFCSIRGRLLTGLEALSLNGIPRDKIIMRGETTREILQLAGNAMSSTVVTSAILAAICACPIGTFSEIDELGELYPRKSQKVSKGIEDVLNARLARKATRENALGPAKPLSFLPSSHDSTQDLFQLARNSVRLCSCEGSVTLTKQPIFRCRHCSHTACKRCAGIPTHSYEILDQAIIQSRIEPSTFSKTLKECLPMRLKFSGLNVNTFDHMRRAFDVDVDKKIWIRFLQTIENAFTEELRFEAIKRTHNWRATYDSPRLSLTLTFSEREMFWELRGKPHSWEPSDSPVRTLFKQPLATMQVKGKDILSGRWQCCVPTQQTIKLEILGKGSLVPCWESTLGIQHPKVVNRKVWSRLQISVDSDMKSERTDQITGEYELFQNCGTAMASLHKKIHPPAQSQDAPIYLYLDPDRNASTKNDSFVFSKDKHRLAYGETRVIIASIESEWRPSNDPKPRVACTFARDMVDCAAVLNPFISTGNPNYRTLTNDIDDLFANELELKGPHHNCMAERHAILSCTLPLSFAEDKGWHKDPWSDIGQNHEYHDLTAFTWLLERVKHLDGFSDRYRPLNPPQDLERCKSCAPIPPSVKWKKASTGNNPKLIAYEDAQEAQDYERAMKARPRPLITRTRINNDNCGFLGVDLNVATMVHRALAKFPSISKDEIVVAWRLDCRYEWPTTFSLGSFKLGSNKGGTRMPHAFVAKQTVDRVSQWLCTGELRINQEESLDWMVKQESSHAPPFYEMEIEEATVPGIGWRAEARVQRPSAGRGGILADDIGYGKTVTMLALIDKQMHIANESSEVPRRYKISLKATLIVLPIHLIHQWKSEISKFLGESYVVEMIRNVGDLKKLTIGRLKQADIVLLSWSLFESPTYLSKIAELAAIPEFPTSSARAFNDRMNEASCQIDQTTEFLKDSTDLPSVGRRLYNTLQKELGQAEIGMLPSKRLTGAAYKAKSLKRKQSEQEQTELGQAETEQTTNLDVDQDSFGLSQAFSLDEMCCPPLSMFHFHRLVVDEYTYVSNRQFQFVNSIKSSYRWVLSGTPRLADFQDVKTLAAFIGVYLGVDDDSSPVIHYNNIKGIREKRTAAERFQALTEQQSPAWHANRHAHAQKFLFHFARKNLVEFGKLPSYQFNLAYSLNSTHGAVYMELQQQLRAQDLTSSRFAKRQGEGDRLKRIQQLLHTSDSSEEALIKCATSFTIAGDDTTVISPSDEDPAVNLGNSPLNSCDIVIRDRTTQYQAVSDEIKKALRHAAWLEKQAKSEDHYDRWKRDIQNNRLGEPDATVELLQWISDANNSYEYSHQEEFYRSTPPTKIETEQNKQYMVFAKKQKANEKKIEASDKNLPAKRKRPLPQPLDMNADVFAGFNNAAFFNKPVAINPRDTERMQQALRVVTAELRDMVNDLISRKRALRFLQNVQRLQRWQSQQGTAAPCDVCATNSDPRDTYVLGTCGHVFCKTCLFSPNRPSQQNCMTRNCMAAAQDHNIHSAKEFDSAEDELVAYGAKLDAVIKTIKAIPNEDQVLLFVQFDSLLKHVAAVLKLENIKHLAIYNSDVNASNTMKSFQENKNRSRKKVLILDPTSEAAAGANITNANHVMFLAPIVKPSFSEYLAAIKQCIGRAQRFGQTKTTFVYHFLALKTIDVDIHQQRSGMRLANSKRGKWVLKHEYELTDEQQVNWGTGFEMLIESASAIGD